MQYFDQWCIIRPRMDAFFVCVWCHNLTKYFWWLQTKNSWLHSNPQHKLHYSNNLNITVGYCERFTVFITVDCCELFKKYWSIGWACDVFLQYCGSIYCHIFFCVFLICFLRIHFIYSFVLFFSIMWVEIDRIVEYFFDSFFPLSSPGAQGGHSQRSLWRRGEEDRDKWACPHLFRC